jgi:phage I-like protein
VPDRFAVLLDAPTTPAPRIQIAKVGDDFRDPRYGEFAITTQEVEDWRKNLAKLPGGRALIDFDHKADKPSPHRDTTAAGWITNIELADDGIPYADVEWSSAGKQAIEDKRYLFFSPAFDPEYRNEKGEVFQNVLTGGALTNKPFLNMPTVTLASAPRLLEAMRDEDQVMTLEQRYEAGLVTLDISQEQREKHATVVKKIDGKTIHMFPIPPGDKEHARKALQLLPAAIKAGHITPQEASKIKARAQSVLGTKELSDSPPTMELTSATLTSLGITDDAKQKVILDMANTDDADMVKVFQAIEDAKPTETTTAMQLTADGLTALGITDTAKQTVILDLARAGDADPVKVFEAIEAAKPKAAPVTPPASGKTLEQQAADEGKILLDQAAVTKLMADSAAGAEAKRELEQSRFETAFEKALQAGKTIPALKERYEGFYKLDADGTLKLLEDAPVAVSRGPRGNPVDPNEGVAPDGVHEGHYELEQAVRAHMKEHKMPESEYAKALEAVSGVKIPVGI